MKKMTNDKTLSSIEQKQILLGLLKFFDKTCRDNGIKYSLIGGSLIGAIRHKGFIPWDDDVDVIMMPGEYKKLLNVLKKTKSHYALLTPGSSKTYRCPFSKLVDTRTTVEEMGYNKIENYGVFLDVFCYHYVPNNAFARLVKCCRQYFLKKMFAVLELNPKTEEGVLKRILYLPSKLVPARLIKRRYAGICNSNKPTKYIFSNWPTYGIRQETQFSKNVSSYIDVRFEDMKAMVFSGYDEILKNTFGDYMKLPPKEKRVSPHKMDIKWRNEVD